MKNKVAVAVHLNIGDYKADIGDIWIFRGKSNIVHRYKVTPRRVARALEAQRLFLAQLEKKAGK